MDVKPAKQVVCWSLVQGPDKATSRALGLRAFRRGLSCLAADLVGPEDNVGPEIRGAAACLAGYTGE